MLGAVLLAALASAAGPARTDAIPVLLVTGANNHDWETTSKALRALLEETGRFDVAVTVDPATALAAPDLGARYRAIVLDYNGPRWGAAAEEGFLRAVRGGTGVAVIHAADNAFEGWVEYEELVAILWRAGTGHGRFHAFDVAITDREHPITATLPDIVQHPDELYHRLVNSQDTDYRVLATAYSDPETGGTGEHEPMVLVKSFGEGRIFHTPLGHIWRGVESTHASFRDPQLRVLIARGVEWAATGAVTDGLAAPNSLTDEEVAAGWRLLFDGSTLAGWESAAGREDWTQGWEVVSGALRHRHAGGGGDVSPVGAFEDFELAFEWKVAAGANSGVKYRVPIGADGMVGPEYQILDDPRHPNGKVPDQRAASLYDLFAPSGLVPVDAPPPHPGTFRTGRIVARGNTLEHWLDEARVVAAEVGSDEWNAAIQASKFRGREGFGSPLRGRIGFQDHGQEVWFRTIKLRDLTPPGEEVTLFDGATLDGFWQYGDAVWEVEDGTLLGRVGGGGQSFLVSERTFSDFVLELDVKPEDRGNSGIQVRSYVPEGGRMTGYQIEIDSSERAWSGGLYEEGARGWLDDLSDNPLGRAAFRYGEWNRYRIECIGPWIRAWINGVPTACHRDDARAEGVIAFQVHSGNNTRVRFRDVHLWEVR